MPRIRKKTSARQTTRTRAKVTKKVAEHKRKTKRAGKKEVQWKSKHKADPGVPNSFHLKDQVLAELAEEKRLVAEARAAAKGRKPQDEGEEDTPGIQTLVQSSVLPRVAMSGVAAVADEDEDDADIPALLDSDLPTLQAALDAADVLLEVVDARDISGTRCKAVEDLVAEADGQVYIIINKIDLVPREALEAWIATLPFPAYLFSAVTGAGREELLAALGKLVKGKKEAPAVALLGLPNVGKTSILNALGNGKFKVAPTLPTANQAKTPAPTTKAPIEVEVSTPAGTIRVIDTPGWEFVEEEEEDGSECGCGHERHGHEHEHGEEEEDDEEEDGDEAMDEDDEEEGDEEEEDEDELDAEEAAKWDALEAQVAGDLLRRNLGRVDRVKDIFPLVNFIVSRSAAQDLMLKYNVPYFEQGDVEAFLTALARVNQRINKFGEPNHDGAARIILRDWAANEFPYYTMPVKGSMEVETAVKQPDMSAVLAQHPTRKELKKVRGLVKFTPSELDTREIFLDDDYTAIEPQRVQEDEDDEEDEEEDELDEDEIDELDEDEEEEEEGSFIGSDEGSEVELEDGSEPESGSDVEEEEEEESEEEEEVEELPSRKRKASGPAPVVRKKAKTVQFPKKLEAPRSRPKGVVELRPILKQPKSALKAPKEAKPAKESKASKKSAKIADAPSKPKGEMSKEERLAAARARLEAKKAEKAAKVAAGLVKPKKAAPAPEPTKPSKKSKAEKKKANGSAPSDAAAYDWRQHF